MVMKRKGNTGPPMMGPPPDTNWVRAGIWRSGRTQKMPRASMAMVPIFR